MYVGAIAFKNPLKYGSSTNLIGMAECNNDLTRSSVANLQTLLLNLFTVTTLNFVCLLLLVFGNSGDDDENIDDPCETNDNWWTDDGSGVLSWLCDI